ncbi:2-oxoglutarate-Fe(II) type oxidoreductase ppzD-like [Portunus trituberculatus]|uniref:2-oxoglutarate-Fe(II) type oxidoreductase ppzD-like n=1 Tax=Portunus trituberculatus TaxID=210409 RepID=UPI001E1CF416|nr:2-oxoglutarate-Fe(II) type oxidoreductase ppzD-like [Portunus trituberculatus]
MESQCSTTHHKIPIVDMGAIGIGKDEKCADPKEWQRVSRELCEALSGVGFVYLSNHGIPDEQISSIVKASAEFFSLNRETKVRYNVPDLGTAHGYMEVDREKLDATGRFSELRESFYMKNMAGAFPDSEVPHLRPAATTFIASCKTLAYRVLTALALGLGLDKDFFVETHRGMCTNSPPNATVMRVNHYPPLPADLPENVIRCGAHTDYGSITLLFQDCMGGLQVRNMDGSGRTRIPYPEPSSSTPGTCCRCGRPTESWPRSTAWLFRRRKYVGRRPVTPPPSSSTQTTTCYCSPSTTPRPASPRPSLHTSTSSTCTPRLTPTEDSWIISECL